MKNKCQRTPPPSHLLCPSCKPCSTRLCFPWLRWTNGYSQIHRKHRDSWPKLWGSGKFMRLWKYSFIYFCQYFKQWWINIIMWSYKIRILAHGISSKGSFHVESLIKTAKLTLTMGWLLVSRHTMISKS